MPRPWAQLLAVGLAVTLATASGPAAADARHAAMVVDANTGAVLYEAAASEPRYPASLTKMMTLYLAFEEIEAGRLSYSSKLTVSEAAAAVAPSKLNLKPGEEIDLIDAIKALITKSANDMAVAVAERIAGSEVAFARLMTERARQLGMTSTTFTNASGLPDPRQQTTARDMLTLALRLEDNFPRHYRLFGLKAFAYRGKVYRSHNTLMNNFPGMDGIKTGYTRASGFNLVSSVRANGKHLVAAVFGGATASARNAHMRMLLVRALEKATTERTREKIVIPPRAMLVASPKAAKPRPKVVAQAEPAPVKKPVVAETKRPPSLRETIPPAAIAATTATEPQPASPPLAAASVTPDISVARVRALAFAASEPSPTAPGTAAASMPAVQPGTPPSSAPPPASTDAQPTALPRLDLMALRAEISAAPPAGSSTAPATIEDIITGAPPVPSPGQRLAAADAPPPSPLSGAAALGGPPSPKAAARPPSSLNAQAAALAPPPAPAAPARTAVAAAPVGSGYEIQIGAYATATEAETRLSQAKSRAEGLLEGHDGVAIPVLRGDRQVFRARFTRFSDASAVAACAELRRRTIECFVMKAD